MPDLQILRFSKVKSVNELRDESQQAEEIARGREDPGILMANIERYRAMLITDLDEERRRTIEFLLHAAEQQLARHKSTK